VRRRKEEARRHAIRIGAARNRSAAPVEKVAEHSVGQPTAQATPSARCAAASRRPDHHGPREIEGVIDEHAALAIGRPPGCSRSSAILSRRRRRVRHRDGRSSPSHSTGKGRVSRASTPPFMNWLRQRRTVSSRTPKASARCGFVQPRSVKRMALALSASARSDPTAFDSSAAICSCVARTGDLPAMLHPPNHLAGRNHKRRPLARPVKPA
jgi:hypothetical protein